MARAKIRAFIFHLNRKVAEFKYNNLASLGYCVSLVAGALGSHISIGHEATVLMAKNMAMIYKAANVHFVGQSSSSHTL
jgi:hypothetical protein